MTRTVITAVNITRYQLPVFVHLSMVIISMNLILRLPFRIFCHHCIFCCSYDGYYYYSYCWSRQSHKKFNLRWENFKIFQ